MNERQLADRLARFDQQHLLAFWDTLDDRRRQAFAAEIEAVDLALIKRLFRTRDETSDVRRLLDRAGQPPAFRLGDAANRFSVGEACRRGEKAIRSGEIGVILVAGGQGTRLGFDHPKGMFPIGPVSGNSIFQIYVEKIVAAARRYGRPIPLAVMTSPATHDETVAFFDEHDRFGLPEGDLFVFRQGTMPAVDAASGKLLLADRDRLAQSPDGHGGMLAALAAGGTLDAFAARDVRHAFYFQVDNPLVDICSPEFLGYHLLSGSELTSQVVAKQSPEERLGNVLEVDGRLHVIEYSELPDEVASRRTADGSLEIWAGSIAVHAMDLEFLSRMARSADALPFHVARKKVAHLDPSGDWIDPEEPNALKFERFIFDLLPAARNAIVVEVDARTHFGPLKNAPGAAFDTAASVQTQMVALSADWLRRAGAEVADDAAVEISPLWALDAEEAAAKIPPGTRVAAPTYFRA